ncbi:Holliday junction branch migration protein RuvA [Ligilactobacillus sp. LYQ60]|uniref:Holliday junction branch migration protein RuvA n=1 Tax=unclassified Ligilactobacillus TaxID=2767920 RepID=UPI0038539D52
MYEYLTGLITAITPGYIVVDVAGVGYRVQVANPFRFCENEKQRVYVYQAVRDTAVTLYGFSSLEEKELFLRLISVAGIGPKSALAILANEDHAGFIAAVEADNVNYLVKYPGIGKKTAKQIILDLKGKLAPVAVESPNKEVVQPPTDDPALREAVAALSALGYTKAEVKRVTKKLRDFEGQSTDEYLREALRLMMN